MITFKTHLVRIRVYVTSSAPNSFRMSCFPMVIELYAIKDTFLLSNLWGHKTLWINCTANLSYTYICTSPKYWFPKIVWGTKLRQEWIFLFLWKAHVKPLVLKEWYIQILLQLTTLINRSQQVITVNLNVCPSFCIILLFQIMMTPSY